MDVPASAAAAAEGSNPAAAAAPAADSASYAAIKVAPGQRARLHLTGLPADWNTQVAQAFFEPLGPILDCVIFKVRRATTHSVRARESNAPRKGSCVAHAGLSLCPSVLCARRVQDQVTGKAKYGFLEFQELDSAIKAIHDYNAREIGGNTMAIGFAKPKGGPQVGPGGLAQESSRLFVGNIGAGATVGQCAQQRFTHGGAGGDSARLRLISLLSLCIPPSSRRDSRCIRGARSGD